MTPEKKIQNQILNYLEVLKKQGCPIFYERRQAGGFSYKKGIPDIYCVYKGIHIEIEVKQEKGSLSPMQEKFRDMCSKFNISYICVKEINELIEFFKNF